MWKNVEWARLQPHSVPMVCAKTGVPTTMLCRQTLVQRRRAKVRLFFIPLFDLPDWLQWIGTLNPFLWLFGHRARIALPIAPGVRRRYNALRAGVVACVGLAVAGMFGLDGALGGGALAVGCYGALALRLLARRVWVSPRWSGVVRLRNPHPAFLAALRGEEPGTSRVRGMPELVPAMPFEPEPEPAKPAPGWYADPGGQHAARWWDGGAWTHQVRGEPA